MPANRSNMLRRRIFRRRVSWVLPAALLVFSLASTLGAWPEPLLVLVYHRIAEGPAGPVPSVAPHDFARQVEWLHRAGYLSITPSVLRDHLREGRPLPGRAVLFTFDDGWSDNYTEALPILRAHGYVATVFVVTGRIGRSGCLTAAQLRRLAAEGWEIGAHAITHPHLPELTPEEARREIEGSRSTLARLLGRPVESFAYPYGDLDPAVETQVRRAGFAMAFGTRLGVPEPDDDLYSLERITVPRRGGLFLIRFSAAPQFKLARRILARLAKTRGAVRIQAAYSRRLGRRQPRFLPLPLPRRR